MNERAAMDHVDFYFDFASPYSYLAHSQLATLGTPVRLVPISVLEVMKLVNNTPTSITCPVKRAYAGKDLARWAGRYGVPFALPDMARLDLGLLLRLAVAAQSRGLGAPVAACLFKAVWGGEGDASPQAVAALLDGAGLPGSTLLAAAQEPAVAEALAASVREAAEVGVFGAPTFRARGELYFGNDRLEFVREAVAALEVAQ